MHDGNSLVLSVSRKFALDEANNPPRLKPIDAAPDGSLSVRVGNGVDLLLGAHESVLDAMLDLRVVVDRDEFTGLGSVRDACAVFCNSNHCREWARQNRRPRMVAKVVGIMADEPRYVLLSQPRLQGAERPRHESRKNRIEAGLVSHVLVEPGVVQCAHCPGPNVGEVALSGDATGVV